MTGGGVRSATLTRLAVAPVLLAAVAVVAVLLPELTGMDSARTVLAQRYADANPDPQVLAALRAQLGLDDPLPVRVAARLGGALTGDFGVSWVSGEPVAQLLASALPISLSLMAAALLVSLSVGLFAGLLAGYRPGTAGDRVVRLGNRVAAAVPEFALAPLLVVLFAVTWRLLPSSGWSGPAAMILPVASLVPVLAAPVAATTREQTRQLRGATFLTAARARGIGEWRLRLLHLARLALPGALSVSTYNAAGMIAGTAAVEVAFDIPGVGSMLVEAVRSQDVPVVQGGLLVAAAIALGVGAVADALRLLVDPRSREAHT